VATVEQLTLPTSPASPIELLEVTSFNPIRQNDRLKENCQSIGRDRAQESYEGAIAQLKTLTQQRVTQELIAQELIAQEALTPVVSPQTSRLPSPIADNIIIAVGPIRPSFAIQDLDRFVETGIVPSGWRFFFSVAGIKAEEFRTALTAEVDVDALFMDRLLNGILGEYLLFQVGQIIHTPSEEANIQAIRSALIFSAVDDGKVSLLEFLRNYPSTDVIIQALNLARFGRNIQNQGLVANQTAGLEDMLLELQVGVAEDICDCEGDDADTL
jgi:hypothetical protein